MHGSHDHNHLLGHADGHETAQAAGHNSGAAQWQTPHLGHDHHHGADAHVPDTQKDLDLVEAAFVEGFTASSDPTSFLRLAGIPFEATGPDGKRLVLLRVEHRRATDIGNVTPHLGGGSFRYAPLPKKLASVRTELSFAFFDGAGVQHLSYDQAKQLTVNAD